MNHFAPLFANFDAAGVYQTTIQVQTPTPANPTVEADRLAAGDRDPRVALRQAAVTDITGARRGRSPPTRTVQKCQVQRAWNWAMSKTDIVNDLAVVPDSTISDVMTVFTSSGMKLKPVFKAIFTAPDFVMF